MSAATECHICHRMQDEPGEVWCSYPHPLASSAAKPSRFHRWHYGPRQWGFAIFVSRDKNPVLAVARAGREIRWSLRWR